MPNESLIKLIQDNTKLLNIIRCYGSIDRGTLCELMELSWPTLQKTMQQLTEFHIILNSAASKENDIKTRTTDNKKEKEEYSINSSIGYYAGISVGGSQLKFTITNASFQALTQHDFYGNIIRKFNLFEESSFKGNNDESGYGYLYLSTPNDFSHLQEIINYILEQLIILNNSLTESGQNLLGIGFAFTGAVDNKKREIIKSFSLDSLKNLPIKYDSLIYPDKLAYFTSHNINITFDNIAKSAIVSEKYCLYDFANPNSIYKTRKNIGCLYLGSGIGCSFILNNTLYRGTSNYNEGGHIDVIDDPKLLLQLNNTHITNELCTCGGEHCAEHKIRKNVFDMDFEKFKTYTSRELKKEFDALENKEIRLELFAFYLAQLIKTTTNMLNLDLIILTGKLSVFMSDLNKYLYNQKSNNPIGYINSDCSLVTSSYGALAPAIGAAILSAYPDSVDSITWW